jgi:hypothetical protein
MPEQMTLEEAERRIKAVWPTAWVNRNTKRDYHEGWWAAVKHPEDGAPCVVIRYARSRTSALRMAVAAVEASKGREETP